MHCILWLHVGSGTHAFDWDFRGPFFSALGRWGQFVHSREAGTPAYAEAVALGSACDYLQHLGMKAIATRHWLRELVKVLRIQKKKSGFTSATGWEATVLWWFYTQFIHVYTVCAEFIDFSCFPRWASLVQKALGACSRPAWRHGVWTFTRGRSSSLVWLLTTFFGWISLCE